MQRSLVGGRGSARVLVALLVVTIAGCKSSHNQAGTGQAGSAAPIAHGPARGGHIKLPSNEPRWLDPILETRFDLANGLIFEGLVGVDSKLDPVGRLAESWTLSDDGKTLTFKLRPGAVWQDGVKITSKDVAFTFNAVRKTTASTLWKGYMAPVAKLETPDDQTVVVTYAYAFAPALVTWTMPIMPEHVYGKVDLSAGKEIEPVGSGPFKMARWEKGKLMLLEANDTWWYGRPNLDSIELVFGIPDSGMIQALRHGQIDWAPIEDVQDWVAIAQASDFLADYEESDVVESRIRLLAWNTQRAPLDDKRVRQGVTMALDRSRVIDDVLLGQARALSAPFFPTMFGADPSIAPWPFDLDRARKVLDEVAPPKKDGKRFSIEVIAIESQSGAVTDATFAIFKHDLETLGIDLKLTFLPAREYFERLAKHDYDGNYFGWLPDIPDPDPYALLDSSQIGTGPNYANYANPEVDKLLDEARATASRDARKKLYARVHAIVADELPYTPLYSPYGHYAWNRRLRGVNPRDLGPQMLFPGVARWWIDRQPAAPKRAGS
jgi:peptide/nickel transport system substrate-binding protein